MDAEGNFSSTGLGRQLLGNLKADGTFDARRFALEGVPAVDRATGEFGIVWSLVGPQFRFPALTLTSGDETWTGTGAANKRGIVVVDLTSEAKKKLHLEGALVGPGQAWESR